MPNHFLSSNNNQTNNKSKTNNNKNDSNDNNNNNNNHNNNNNIKKKKKKKNEIFIYLAKSKYLFVGNKVWIIKYQELGKNAIGKYICLTEFLEFTKNICDWSVLFQKYFKDNSSIYQCVIATLFPKFYS